jgi:hypothetical protein
MHGRFDAVTRYDDKPRSRLAAFAAAGATWAHIVDLDGAEAALLHAASLAFAPRLVLGAPHLRLMAPARFVGSAPLLLGLLPLLLRLVRALLGVTRLLLSVVSGDLCRE